MPILDTLSFKACKAAPIKLQRINRIQADLDSKSTAFGILLLIGIEYHEMSQADALIRQRFHILASSILPLSARSAGRSSSSSDLAKSPVPLAKTHVVTVGKSGLDQNKVVTESKHHRDHGPDDAVGGTGVSQQEYKKPKRKEKLPAFDVDLFNSLWWGNYEGLWMHLSTLRYDHFLMLHVIPYKHFTKKDDSPLIISIPIATEASRKVLSSDLMSSTTVTAMALQRTASAFFPFHDGIFINIRGSPKDTARKQYPLARPYGRVSVSDHVGMVEPAACKRVEFMISKVEPSHYHSTTQRIVDPRDPTKPIFVPTIFDVTEDGSSALYEYLLSNLNPVEDLS
jgi:hypothetical protein